MEEVRTNECIQCTTPDLFFVAAGDLLERCRRLAIIDSSGNSERDGKCLKKISTTLREAAPRGKEDESSSDVGHKRPREQEGLQDERTWTI